MKELFDFIKDSYDPDYSVDPVNQTAENQNVSAEEKTTQQNNVVVNDLNATTNNQQQVTTDYTTLPYDKSMRKAETLKSSTTTEAKDKGNPIYEVNNQLILDLGSASIERSTAYSTRLFKAAGQNPVIDGKPIDVSALPEIMKDPNKRKQVMDQANKLFNDPNLDFTEKWEAEMDNYYAVGIEKAIPLIKKKMDDMMFKSASAVDANLKARNKTPKGTNLNTTVERGMGWGWITILGVGTTSERDDYHDVNATELFDKDGKLLDQKEFDLFYLQKKVDAYNSLVGSLSKQSGGAKSAITNYNQEAYTDVNGVRHVMNYNKMNEARYKDQQEELTELNRRLEMARQWKAAGLESELSPENTYESLMKKGLPSNWRQTSTDPNVRKISNAGAYANTMGGQVSYEALPKLTSKNYKQIVKQMQDNLNKMGYRDYAKNASFQRSEKVYTVLKNKIIEEYNRSDNAAVYKIKADLENKFKQNKGGDVQAEGVTINFDWNAPYVDKNKKKSGGFKQGINEMYSIINYAVYDDGSVRYSYGGLRGEKTGESLVPDKNDDASADIKAIANQLMADVSSGEQAIIKGKKGSVMLPQGSFTFTRKVFDADGNEYHAFNVKLNPNYLNQRKFKGTEDKPGVTSVHPELVTDGFTIFVPKNVAIKNNRVALETEKADELSNTEVNLALDGKSENYFNGAGQINLTQNPENFTITLDGYYVNFVPSKNAYDTIRFQPKIFQADQFTDIDKSMDEQIDILKGVYFNNEQNKKDLLQIKGVKDPLKLQQKQQ